MTRYAGEVSRRRFLAGLLLAAVGVAVMVGLTQMLVPRGEILPPLPAPAEEDPVTPGAIVCPPASELPQPDEPVEIDAGTLIDCPVVFDGHRVRYAGEVVEAVLPRGDRAWVHLNDDLYSGEAGPLPQSRTALGGNSGIAVSLPADDARAIHHVGGHRAQGDRLEVVGTFHAADPADGGAPTIQADKVRVLRVGHVIEHPVSQPRLVVAIALALLAAIATLATRLRGSA